MDKTKLEKGIAARAQERATAKVIKFRERIESALKELCDGQPSLNENIALFDAMKSRTLKSLLYDKFPAALHERQEQLVTDEVMRTMNELQRVLLVNEKEVYDNALTERP